MRIANVVFLFSALFIACKPQQPSGQAQTCRDWRGEAEAKKRFDFRCPLQGNTATIALPHFLLQDGSVVDASAGHPYVWDHVLYFRQHTVIQYQNNLFDGMLIFTRQKDTIGELVVKDGFIQKIWLKDSLGNTFVEDWNPAIQPPIEPIEPSMPVKKPVLYLYPEQEQVVSVRLRLAGALEHSYPAYPQEGWQVLAQPNGNLKSLQTGKEYYALYWEAQDQPSAYTVQQGFVVKGKDTEVFLDQTLEQLGFTRREANGFIMYWLPILEKNAYNLLHFSTEQYVQRNRLEIEPKPQSSLRVMMLYRPLEAPMSIAPQTFSGFERKGFTVVEWGGALWQEGM